MYFEKISNQLCRFVFLMSSKALVTKLLLSIHVLIYKASVTHLLEMFNKAILLYVFTISGGFNAAYCRDFWYTEVIGYHYLLLISHLIADMIQNLPCQCCSNYTAQLRCSVGKESTVAFKLQQQVVHTRMTEVRL